MYKIKERASSYQKSFFFFFEIWVRHAYWTWEWLAQGKIEQKCRYFCCLNHYDKSNMYTKTFTCIKKRYGFLMKGNVKYSVHSIDLKGTAPVSFFRRPLLSCDLLFRSGQNRVSTGLRMRADSRSGGRDTDGRCQLNRKVTSEFLWVRVGSGTEAGFFQ